MDFVASVFATEIFSRVDYRALRDGTLSFDHQLMRIHPSTSRITKLFMVSSFPRRGWPDSACDFDFVLACFPERPVDSE